MKQILKHGDKFLKGFRFILLPLSAVYGCIISIRNKLYDKNILKSSSFNFPIICIGNLSVGGTGKTPMVEYLIRLLKNRYSVATLSRGYKRKTEGFAIADKNTTALDIGDEPMQFHKKFDGITVAVAEERLVGIPQLLHAKPNMQVIILDDAFQHRQVNAGLNILLTECKNLFTRNFILPAGDLRDVKTSSKRADIIVVTKCDPDLTQKEKNETIQEIKSSPEQRFFFTTMEYDNVYHLFTKEKKIVEHETNVLLVCGIANPEPLKDFTEKTYKNYESIIFNDHHIFDTDDLKNIKHKFSKINSDNKIILTTEKDGVRLMKFQNELESLPIYILPFKHKFLFNEGEKFDDGIITFIASYNSSM